MSEDGYAEFRFFRPNVSSVCVAGDFNDWRTDQLRMVRNADGWWVLKLRLPAGDYRFRYIADGVWYTDYAAFGVEPGRFGMDSLLLVPSRPMRVVPAAGPSVEPPAEPRRHVTAA